MVRKDPAGPFLGRPGLYQVRYPAGVGREVKLAANLRNLWLDVSDWVFPNRRRG